MNSSLSIFNLCFAVGLNVTAVLDVQQSRTVSADFEVTVLISLLFFIPVFLRSQC